ncbi:helix-turn-helix domain-containing protein [Flavobacteriaceae bacterium]|nr:helix-turn-helix domain-containing protein [bacterium]MDA8904316.1 helix-turn-helix domain-containing protein [Flavobacteriaceae bacterium]MDA9067149.1 helix-turn-helix domain-containing protein [Flavobacteriaceae bacterium]MDB4133659.1 helix-turn-helix domain-containing protein [Flavobacteriaceae bacterium]MDB4180015.1 helix-turn-helix domain-containing protein [Flavobacteriaceae bacterium]
MKQPLLGKKITELRKQKGLTQEELVERCNVTVRTIQRIESGETTPRIYTIKTILNALGLDYEKVFEREYNEGKFDKILRFFPSNLKEVLNVSFIAGMVYFVLGFVEMGYYTTSFFDLDSQTNWSDLPIKNYGSYSDNGIYIFIKIISIISFSLLMRGFVLVGSYYKNYLVELMAFVMIIMHIIFEISEIVSINFENSLVEFIMISKAVTFGVSMIFFGVGLLRLKSHLGNLPKITGILEIITGICFATVFLSVFGLIFLTPLELLELLLLYKVASKIRLN